MSQLIVLENEFWQIGILPQTGGSIAFGRMKHDGAWYDVFRPTHETDYTNASKCSSFVMVPWSNRIRDGKFTFNGQHYQLPINHKDGTAIHGIGRDLEWTVRKHDANRLELGLDTRKSKRYFPMPFTSKVDFRLNGKKFAMTIEVKNVGKNPMPAGFGHHPYFQRTLTDSNDFAKIKIPYSHYFALENMMAIDNALPIPKNAVWDYQRLRLLGDKPLDHVVTTRQDKQPIRIHYVQSKRELIIRPDPIYEHVVFYAPLRETFFAIEPVTNVNDGFNLMEKGIEGHGVFVLNPLERQKGKIVFELK
ncbi:MAG: aldose epimerase [bacterium]|nr:aldose epimerase [bacterium]